MARLEAEQRELAYRIYITDSLYYDGRNKVMNKRFEECLEAGKKNKQEIDGDELAAQIIKNAGLILKE